MPLLRPEMIFVFGSNLAGIHGAGAALTARLEHGAILGQGVGRQGNSYAIPTKSKIIINGQSHIGPPLPIDEIKTYVDEFIQYAKSIPDLFQVTQIGTGHAGFTHVQMAPLFVAAPDSCLFDTAWKPWLGERRYWGTYRG
jgi:hypothetical protein